MNRSVTAYNKAVGSLETRVAVSARRLKEMQVAEKELPAVDPLETLPRTLTGELSAGLSAGDEAGDGEDA